MAKYMDSGGLSHFMAKVKAAIAATVTGVKGNAESTYRTGQVNITAANVGAIAKSETGNTQQLARPWQLNGVGDVTLQGLFNTVRANRLAFLPPDQIIIEKTTDGGTTWVDAEVSDWTKLNLFSETRPAVNIPLLNGVKSLLCGIRVTFSAMKYNVPEGTAETEKYNYWSATYVKTAERYNQIKELYFWVNANSDTIGVTLERATGANPTAWQVAFKNDSFGMTGWAGNDYIRFSQGVFGGGTNQTGQWWNYRLTFMTRGPGGGTTLSPNYTGSNQQIFEIRGYGDTWWNKGNEYAANDKLYAHDSSQNAIFPASIFPKQNNYGSLGNSNTKWNSAYATTFYGNLSGNVTGNVTGNVSATTVATGTDDSSYFQTRRLRGQGDASTYYHAIDFGYASHDRVDFYEYGGIFAFHRHTGAGINDGDTLLGTINSYGWEGNVKGNVTGNVTGTAANVTGTVAIANGGTGQTTATNAANSFLNALSTGSSDPTDADYYISQYVGGGTTTTTYHRRPMSALWNYVKGKFKSTMLSSATNSSSEDLAATPKAVKAAYDLANTANTTAGQAMSAATGALTFKVTYSVEDGAVTCYAHVYSAGSEVTEDYEDECFDWSMTLDGGTSWVVLGTGREMPLTAMTAFGGNVKCDFTPPES